MDSLISIYPKVASITEMMWTISLLLITLFLTKPASAARSLAARRIRPATAPDRYDRSITTFSPEGRLLQLEYALIAAEERGWGLTVCVEWEGIVVFAFPSVDSSGSFEDYADGLHNDEQPLNDDTLVSNKERKFDYNSSHNTKVHRLSPTHLLLTSGLTGDSRTLASAFRRLISSWTHIQYGESISVREVAREMGMVRHGIGLRPGARVLGVVGVIIGLEDVDCGTEAQALVRMYKSLPGGTIDRCNICCTGGGADSLGRRARKETMETLSQVLSLDTDELLSYNCDASLNKKDNSDKMQSINDRCLERIIEEVARAALKHHPHSNSKDDHSPDYSTGNARTSKPAVDIWVIKAAPTEKSNQSDTTASPFSTNSTSILTKVAKNNALRPAFLSSHRCLVDALMNIRYATKVSCNNLPVAITYLTQ
jgi:20S proteasome alpha/beta subunit